jgi:hypothetical protein
MKLFRDLCGLGERIFLGIRYRYRNRVSGSGIDNDNDDDNDDDNESIQLGRRGGRGQPWG